MHKYIISLMLRPSEEKIILTGAFKNDFDLEDYVNGFIKSHGVGSYVGYEYCKLEDCSFDKNDMSPIAFPNWIGALTIKYVKSQK